jgi:tetrahydromethanopterin S-methyltransferase subunit A
LDRRREWPKIPGDYVLGNAESPIAIAIIGKGSLDLPPERYAIKGTIKTENVGLEKVVANIVANPRIRFLIVCGKEEMGHQPGEAIEALYKNGVDERMRIRGCRSAIPYLCNIDTAAIERFRSQVEVVSQVNAANMRELPEWQAAYVFGEEESRLVERSALECAARDPGPFPGQPLILDNEALRLEGENIARMNNRSADSFIQKMLRMPSEKFTTNARLVTVSEEFGLVIEPLDGEVMRVVSPEFAGKLNAYLRMLD